MDKEKQIQELERQTDMIQRLSSLRKGLDERIAASLLEPYTTEKFPHYAYVYYTMCAIAGETGLGKDYAISDMNQHLEQALKNAIYALIIKI